MTIFFAVRDCISGKNERIDWWLNFVAEFREKTVKKIDECKQNVFPDTCAERTAP
jgi:hypothetical protein